MDADSPPAPRMNPNFRYVLYVHAACDNSKSILQLLRDTIPQQGMVKVQHIEKVGTLDSLPPWLDGTPIFVDSINGTIYRGQEAFHAVAHVAMDIKEHEAQMQEKSMEMAEAHEPPSQRSVFNPSPQQAAPPRPSAPVPPEHRQQHRQTQPIKLSTEGWGNGHTPTIKID